MSIARAHPMSLTEFLAWEERQEFKYEFDGFEPFAMVSVTVAHSVIIFEIVSNESDRRDRITENDEYRLTPSVQRYVMLEQDEPAAMIFAREGERWLGTLHKSDAILAMPEIGIEIPLAEFYEGLDFSENAPTA